MQTYKHECQFCAAEISLSTTKCGHCGKWVGYPDDHGTVASEFDFAEYLDQDSRRPQHKHAWDEGGICWCPVLSRFLYLYGVHSEVYLEKARNSANGKYESNSPLNSKQISHVRLKHLPIYSSPTGISRDFTNGLVFADWLSSANKYEIEKLHKRLVAKAQTALPSIGSLALGAVVTVATVGLGYKWLTQNNRKEDIRATADSLGEAIRLRFG
ncbi:MAG: hypothetical protein ACKVN9_02150 [Methylophilaceae bacterium]